MIELTINGTTQRLDIDPDMPLLWAIRDAAGLTGTKYGCGLAQCGACMVFVEGEAVFSCVTPASAVRGKAVTTIEGLATPVSRAVQAAWKKLEVVQCGYCQPGQIVAAVALLSRNPQPSDADINTAMAGNLCRCHTYARIRAAVREASRTLA